MVSPVERPDFSLRIYEADPDNRDASNSRPLRRQLQDVADVNFHWVRSARRLASFSAEPDTVASPTLNSAARAAIVLPFGRR